MGYKIVYGGQIHPRKKKVSLKKLATAFILLSLVAAAITVKTVGLPWVEQVLLPGDPRLTSQALADLADSIRQGTSLWQALETFCREIVFNAGLS